MGDSQRDGRGLRAIHLLLLIQGLVFLALVIGGEDRGWTLAAIEGLGVTDLASLVERPWTLLTHPLVNVHPLPFVVSAGILLLVGSPLEHALGSRAFLAVYGGSAAIGGLGHALLFQLGAVAGPAFVGATCASAGLLTVYLFRRGAEQRVGSVPYPVIYLLAACFLFMVLALVRASEADRSQQRIAELSGLAYGQQARTAALRRADLLQIGAVERTRTDLFGHLLGLVAGALALGCTTAAGRARDRLHVHRQIRGLQEEVDARARVEELLAKISQDGMESLTRQERKFLRYASRFYRSGRHPVSGSS